MKTVNVFDEVHTKTEELQAATATTTKPGKTEKTLHVNVAKSDFDEYCSNKTTASFANINHGTTNTIIIEKIPKIETDEQNLWSDDNESNDEPDQDPFADVKCDLNFVLCDNPPSDLAVQQQEPEKSTEINLGNSHLLTTSKHTLPTPTPTSTTTIAQNNSQFQFDCKLCLTKLGSQNDLKSHVSLCSTTHKDRRFFCVDCNIKYASTYRFRNHNLKVHRRGIEAIKPEFYRVQLKCQFCPLIFVLREKFKIHTESHVKKLDLDTVTTVQNKTQLELKLNPYKCQECDSTFSTVTSLSDHVLAKHVDHIFKCPHEKCEKIFNTKGKLNQHFNIHSDARPFQCPEPNCGKRFKWKHILSRHISSHSSKTKLFICSEPNCSTAFGTEEDLVKHDELHNSGDSERPSMSKPFVCPECHMAFAQNWRVTVHVKMVHRQREPFRCPHPNCGKTFKYETSVSVHVKELHGSKGNEESFKCSHPGCKFTCKRKNYIKVHMRTHTGERPFKCSVVEGCFKTFIRYSDLKNHIKEKHLQHLK